MSTNTTREASEWVVPGPPGAIVEKEGPRNGAASRRFVPGDGDVPGSDADCGDGRVAQGFRPAGVPRPGARNNRGDGPAGEADYGVAAEERGGTGPGDDGGAERRGGQKPQVQGPALQKPTLLLHLQKLRQAIRRFAQRAGEIEFRDVVREDGIHVVLFGAC
jgi:hypothetical protein